MKTLFKFLLLLIPLLVQATDITVPVGSDITPYVAQAKPGDNVILLAGNYTIYTNARPAERVGVKGAGVDVTYISTYTFNWWTGAIHLQGGDGGGQIISGFTLIGNNSAFQGIKVAGRNNVIVEKVKVKDFIYSGIEVWSDFEKTQSNVTLQDFSVYNSSMEGGSSFGNVQLRGDLNKITVQRFYIEATLKADKSKFSGGVKGSGYGIKCFSNWISGDLFSQKEFQRNILVKSGKFKSKPDVVNSTLPNFCLEVWNVNVENFEITDCDFDQQVSLENGFQKDVPRSFWVHHNRFALQNGQSIELTASHSLVEYNDFTFAYNKGWLNLFGTYNGQKNIRGIVFRYNTVDFAGKSVLIANTKGQYVGLLVENNIFKNGSATGVYFETDKADGASVTWRNNTVPQSFAKATYSGVSASQVTYNYSEGMATIPNQPPVTNPPVTDPPVVTPPVVTPPTTTPPVSRVDTVIKEVPVYYETTVTKRDSLVVDRVGDQFIFKVVTKQTSSTVKK